MRMSEKCRNDDNNSDHSLTSHRTDGVKNEFPPPMMHKEYQSCRSNNGGVINCDCLNLAIVVALIPFLLTIDYYYYRMY